MMKTHRQLTRRLFLATGLAGLAAHGAAAAPARSLRPAPRPAEAVRTAGQPAVPSADEMVESADLTGRVGFAVTDTATGRILEARDARESRPPASVAKTVTALYALDALGAGYRFRTRLLADGDIVDGRLDGDLILEGSGDPVLDSDALGDMAAELAEQGLREVTGGLRVHAGALPSIPAIDPGQPVEAGYNPPISGFNLNFNRVHFGWSRAKSGYDVVMDARARRYRPEVSVARMRVVDRSGPVYTYAREDGRDIWTVARGALGSGGSRWLPVRSPEHYAAEVFRRVARYHGISIAKPLLGAPVPAPISGKVLVEHRSEPLLDILRDMLRYSTNLTAEAVGLAASLARGGRPDSLSDSAGQMADWAERRFGLADAPRFVDHSGLGAASRISASDMLHILVKASGGALPELLDGISARDTRGRIVDDSDVSIVAKTGTLNFVSALAGYVTTESGRELAFAFFAADTPRRDSLPKAAMTRPPGGRVWLRRARNLQHRLIARWAEVFDA